MMKIVELRMVVDQNTLLPWKILLLLEPAVYSAPWTIAYFFDRHISDAIGVASAYRYLLVMPIGFQISSR